MKVTYELTKEDYRSFYKSSLKRHFDSQERVTRWIVMSACFSVVASLAQGSLVAPEYTLLFVVLIAIIDYLQDFLVVRLRAGARADRYFDQHGPFGETTIELAPEGITGWSRRGNSFAFWETVQRVERDGHRICIFFDDTPSYWIP